MTQPLDLATRPSAAPRKPARSRPRRALRGHVMNRPIEIAVRRSRSPSSASASAVRARLAPTHRPWPGTSQSSSTTSQLVDRVASLRAPRRSRRRARRRSHGRVPSRCSNASTTVWRVGRPDPPAHAHARQRATLGRCGAAESSARSDAAARRGGACASRSALFPAEDDGLRRSFDRAVVDGLDVVAVGVEHVAGVVAGVVVALAGAAVVLPPASIAASKKRSTASRSGAWKARWSPDVGVPSLVT